MRPQRRQVGISRVAAAQALDALYQQPLGRSIGASWSFSNVIRVSIEASLGSATILKRFLDTAATRPDHCPCKSFARTSTLSRSRFSCGYVSLGLGGWL